MRNTVILLILASLVGCADMTPRQRYWTEAGVAVLAAGAIAISQQRSGAANNSPQRGIGTPNCAADPISCR